jgi:surface protein
MNTLIQETPFTRKQHGINMVDLMMWLVIAAMLLAAALQGIGYYQKSAYIYQMKNDALHAAELVTAKAAQKDGSFTTETVTLGASESTKTKGVTITPDAGASDSEGYVLRTTHPEITDKDVLFLSAQRGGYSPGIHVVGKGTVIAPDGATSVDPDLANGSGGGNTVITPLPTGVMTSVWNANFPYEQDLACSTITLPLNGTVNATVDWGDGNIDTVTSASPTHTYAATGKKTVTVTGSFTEWGGESDWSEACITSVEEWGTTGTTSLKDAFYDAYNLTTVAEIPAGVTDLTNAFVWAESFNSPVSHWDTSKVTSMRSTFGGASSFNQDLTSWDTSKVTDMSDMFWRVTSSSTDFSQWDTSNVENMSYMFSRTSINPAVSGWNVGKVRDFSWMFSDTDAFNADLSGWDTSNATNMNNMFSWASAFTGNIGTWDTSKVTNMESMFLSSSFNGNISGWDVSKVQNMSSMFSGAAQFNQNIGGWNTSSVINMDAMFGNAVAFNQNIGGWSTSSVTDMGSMFSGAAQFNQNIASWDTGSVTDMSGMFGNTPLFNQNIGGWDTSSVTNISYMFSGAAQFNQNIASWDMSHVTNMSGAFLAASVFNHDIGIWKTGNATNMDYMFYGALQFNQNLASWDTSNVTAMSYMFADTPILQDLSGWNVAKVASYDGFWVGKPVAYKPLFV